MKYLLLFIISLISIVSNGQMKAYLKIDNTINHSDFITITKPKEQWYVPGSGDSSKGVNLFITVSVNSKTGIIWDKCYRASPDLPLPLETDRTIYMMFQSTMFGGWWDLIMFTKKY